MVKSASSGVVSSLRRGCLRHNVALRGLRRPRLGEILAIAWMWRGEDHSGVVAELPELTPS